MTDGAGSPDTGAAGGGRVSNRVAGQRGPEVGAGQGSGAPRSQHAGGGGGGGEGGSASHTDEDESGRAECRCSHRRPSRFAVCVSCFVIRDIRRIFLLVANGSTRGRDSALVGTARLKLRTGGGGKAGLPEPFLPPPPPSGRPGAAVSAVLPAFRLVT